MARDRQAVAARTALAVLAALLLGGCGLRTGYAPDTVPVYSGGPPMPGPGPAPVAGDSLTIVTWNIQYGEQVALALSQLRAHPRLAAADVIMLQEMDREGVALLADSLGLDWVYAPAAVHPHHARLFGNAVLSRYPLGAVEPVILPHPTPLTGHHRIAVAADMHLGGGAVLRVVSAHTATVVVAWDKRLDQAATVLDSLTGTGPALVAGDFNTASDWGVTLLRRTARRRGFREVRLPPGPTIANRWKRLPGSGSVLDHVFVRGVAAGARGVVRTTTASDHYPVWAVIATPSAPAVRR